MAGAPASSRWTAQKGRTRMKLVKDVLALLGLVLVSWIVLALLEALGQGMPVLGR
jgi:hypothetical protein